MRNIDVLAVAGLVFGYALVSRRLATRWVSTPMFFVAGGLLAGVVGLDVIDEDFIGPGLELLAEVTLVMVLFSDATRLDVRKLRSESNLPMRLLLLGLPLTIVFGALIGRALFPALGLAGAFVLAIALAPTDAALGQAVVSDPSTPLRIRQALNVESGLNDGLTAPMVTIAIGLAAVTAGESESAWLLIVREVGFGLAVGLTVGFVGGWLLNYCTARKWVDGRMIQLGSVALAICTYALAGLIGGNGFVAAFAAGAVFGAVAGKASTAVTEFAENEGQLLTLLTFLFWSVKVAYPVLGDVNVRILVYVALSLTVIRMVPVAISLIGDGLRPQSVAYLGWFGPRGLASILYGFSAAEGLNGQPGTDDMLVTITWTVLASVFLHGLTSVPFAAAYGNWYASRKDADRLPEARSVPKLPVIGDHRQRAAGG